MRVLSLRLLHLALHVSTRQSILGSHRQRNAFEFQNCIPDWRNAKCCYGLGYVASSYLGVEASSPSQEAEDWSYCYSHDGFFVSFPQAETVGYFLTRGSVVAVSTVRLATIPTAMVNPDFTWVSSEGYVWWYVILTSSHLSYPN
jgi:hypothetical protein